MDGRITEIEISTLETRGERLTLGEVEDLEAFLSEEESAWMVDRDSPMAADFSAEEFVERVSDREDVDVETDREHVRQVATGLESFAPAEMERVREQLGPDYSSLV